MANLTTDKLLDKHQRSVKSGEENTSLELAIEGYGAKVKGDLEITGELISLSSSPEFSSSGDLTISATNDIILDSEGDIQLNNTTGDVIHTIEGSGSFKLKGTNVSATGNNTLRFITQRGADDSIAAGQDGDALGKIIFLGYNAAGTPELISFGHILCEILDATNASEVGQMSLKVKTKSGSGTTNVVGLLLSGSDTSDEVDVTIGAGAASVVTLAGDTITTGGDLTLNADGADIHFAVGGTAYLSWSAAGILSMKSVLDADDTLEFVVGGNGVSSISTNDDSGGNLADLTLNAEGDLTLNSKNGIFIMENNGTEFSATNSAYAGMILGYTDIGLNEAHATHNLTTSYTVPTDEFSVSFTAPPSGNVEIWFQIWFHAGTTGVGDLFAGLSNDNATDGYDPLASYHEELLIDGSGRSGIEGTSHSWTLTGLAAGNHEYWVGFKSSTTTGTPYLRWGGNASGRNPDFIMKAIALPATITT